MVDRQCSNGVRCGYRNIGSRKIEIGKLYGCGDGHKIGFY